MNRSRKIRVTGLMAAVTLMAALSFSLFAFQPQQVSAQTTPPTVNITIQNFAFSPATITIPVGTKVIWTNKDSMAHTVTSDSGDMLKSALIPQNTTFEFTFTTAGTFSYHCTPHPNMKANIVVTAATSAAPATTAASSSPVKAPATGAGGSLTGPTGQDMLLWLIPLTALGLISLVALVRRRSHR